jgi:hypothetical protein
MSIHVKKRKSFPRDLYNEIMIKFLIHAKSAEVWSSGGDFRGFYFDATYILDENHLIQHCFLCWNAEINPVTN